MREHQAMVYSLAYHFLHNRAAAEDLTQDVFLRLYQSLPGIQSPGRHVKHWLRQTTSRRCIDIARRARLRRFLSLGSVPNRQWECASPIQRSNGNCEPWFELPPKLRMTVVLRYQEDLEPGDIAEVLGIPLNTVKSSLRRSLARLRHTLARQSQGVSK